VELALPKSVDSGKLNVSKAVVWWMPVQAAMVIEGVVMAGLYHHTQRATGMLTGASLCLVGWLLNPNIRSGDSLWWLFAVFAALVVCLRGSSGP
jgi:hypothetical protein